MMEREGEQARGRRKGRPASGIRQPGKSQGTAGTHLFVENRRPDIGHAVELTGTADDHRPSAGQLIHTAGLEPVAHQFEGLLDPRTDDADQDRARDVVGPRAILLADQRHVDDVVLVVGLGDGAADLGLHALGMGKRCRQPTGDVAGDVLAADRDGVDMHQMAFVEDGDRGRAATHVDQGDAQVALVRHQRAQPRGVGRHDAIGDLEMGAAHADLQVAHRPARRRDQVHVDAQPLAGHAARVAHRRAVDRVADRL